MTARATFVTEDGQRILVEASPTFLNVRLSVDNGEPIAIPCELVSAVAQALVLAGSAARRQGMPHPTMDDLPPTALHPPLVDLVPYVTQPVQINEQTR